MGTDDDDQGYEPIRVGVHLNDIKRIFELADQIAQMQVRYDSDQLKMANAAIEEMQDAACEIASIVAGYD
jgi:hypothetical protein